MCSGIGFAKAFVERKLKGDSRRRFVIDMATLNQERKVPIGTININSTGAWKPNIQAGIVLSQEEMARREHDNILAVLEKTRGRIYGPGAPLKF